MTTPVYTRSTNGTNDADNGTTWALAKTSLDSVDGASSIDEAGGIIYVSDNHAESTAAAITIALAGTGASPVKVLCVDDTGDPVTPTVAATSATVTTTGTGTITITGHGYIDGIAFSAGSGATQSNLSMTGTGSAHEAQVHRNCDFILGNGHASATIVIGTSTSNINQFIRWRNCDVKFNAAGQIFTLAGRFEWHGGAAIAGSTPTTVFSPSTNFGGLEVRGVDFSAWGTGFNFFGTTHAHPGRALIEACKLPSGWTGVLVANEIVRHGFRAVMRNCDSGDTNYSMWVEDACGSVKASTAQTRTGGATDGTTQISWKMEADNDLCSEVFPLYTEWMEIWIDSTGAAKTITLSFLHDSPNPLKDSEIWLEMMGLATSGFPLGTWYDDHRDSFVATAADQATDNGSTWSNSGSMTNPQKQKVNFSFTPQEKGKVMVRVALAVPGEIVYLDPKIVVT